MKHGLKYKIRKEKSGAYLFDADQGKVKFIEEAEVEKTARDLGCEMIYPKEFPDDCFSAPSKVYFELTRRCNLRCGMCYNESGKELKDEMTTAQVFRILDELSSAGTFETRFTGGEPTQRKDFFDIVNYADEKGFFTSIGTNGVWSGDMLDKIAGSGLKMIIVSLEGDRQLNDSIRGKGSFDKAVRTLEYLSKNTGKQLRINLTLAKHNTGDNIGQLDFIVNLADRLGVPVINTMPIRLNGRSRGMKDMVISPEEYLSFVRHVEGLRKTCKASIQTYFDILGDRSRWLENQTSLINKSTCAAGVEACIIAPNGDVYGCAASNAAAEDAPQSLKRLFIAGNAKNEPFMRIWSDSSRWRSYRDIKANKSESCKACEHYGKKCFGNCFISSYLDTGRLNSDDPYCFSYLLKDDMARKIDGGD
jgi:radical SAM protein with 4Fe4S-binding SPASM domain